MALILCIETGTDICSVGIAENGELVSLRESDEGRDHARKVGVFVDEILKENRLDPDDLDAVAAPSARGLARLAQTAFDGGDFADLAYFEPFYLKDFVVTTSRKKLF